MMNAGAATLFSDLDDRVTRCGLSDVFGAEMFAEAHGHNLRFDDTSKTWRAFEHPIWRRAKPGEIQDLLIGCARSFQRHAETLPQGTARDKCLSWSKFLLTKPGLARVESIAQKLKPFAADHSEWNQNPWVIAAANDVIDLKTGGLITASREQRLTLALPIAFEPRAQCPRFHRFLDEIFNSDPELIAYMWRVLGYLLTGSTAEQVWWLWYGNGANGKSTLLNLLAYILGEYSLTAPLSMFQRHSNIPADLAKLPGKRFVHASETTEGKRLDEAKMKMLTGGDRITARDLYESWSEFIPMHKIILSCNYLPPAQDNSHGYWRRVHLVPFAQRFEGKNRDPRLEETLKAEAPGILASMIIGCLDWQQHGLQRPEKVQLATTKYRSEADQLAEFLDQCCVLGEGAESSAQELFAAYTTWAVAQRIAEDQIYTGTAFGLRLSEQFAKKKTSVGRVYVGLCLR